MSPGYRFPGTQDQGLRFLGLKVPRTYTPGDLISLHTGFLDHNFRYVRLAAARSLATIDKTEFL
jgi:hypothetical protein